MTSLLPPNAAAFERALEASSLAVAVPVPIKSLWNPATCPESLLPWLAWAVSCDTWNPDWPIAVKRARIASSIAIHRHKGSVQSVLDVIADFRGTVVLTEWFNQSPEGDPGTFTLDLALTGQNGQEASADYVDDVIEAVTQTKPLSRHFTFQQASSFVGRIGMVAVARACIYARLKLTAEAAA